MDRSIKFLVLVHFLLIGACAFVQGQNLVPNGDFEIGNCGIWGSSDIDGWFQLNSADYYLMECPILNNTESRLPHRGDGFVGLYNGGESQWPTDTFPTHEYIVAKLDQTLVAEQEYHVSYWVKPSSYFDHPWENYSSPHIDLAFISDSSALRLNRIDPHDIIIALEPDIRNPHGIIHNTDEYTEISTCYQARGDENYLVIGNFEAFRSFPLEPLSANTIYPYSYILVDEVRVEAAPGLSYADSTLCAGDTLAYNLDTTGLSEIFLNGDAVVDSNFSILDADQYVLEAQFGACALRSDFIIAEEKCSDCNYFVPNVFSPDDNGVNDRFEMQADCDFMISSARVFDRWGNLLYEKQAALSWDGTAKGKKMNPGVYTYIIDLIELPEHNAEPRILTGTITLLR